MKSFVKILLGAILLTGSANSFAKPHPTVKSNHSEIVDRHLSGFSGVHVGGSFDVYITQGNTESVKVEAPDDVIDRVITEVKDGVLKIYNKHHDGWNWGELWGFHKKVIVYVTAKDLNSIDISGSGDVFFKDGITTNSLKLKISGSGDILGKVDVKNLESHISGSGDMKFRPCRKFNCNSGRFRRFHGGQLVYCKLAGAHFGLRGCPYKCQHKG